ncbi:glycosyl transferase family 1 [Clostridium butyricum]|uniref:Glycosyl transferase family 1 n=1 Tax=Clostridium butyricum TaxID=1492 RepID=A0A2S7F859_CLOBU|nr:glycosyl transferase family 1 [Clostridium butyricum]KHD13831.1 glycosyl transferase family 1 [Clostridium butyricum]PPV13430.1 glycosyl transferase family 1 [Clostridium butyricum]
MINILVECPELIASVKVGVLKPLEPFIEKYKCNVIYKRTIDIKTKDICNCDIFITVRGCEFMTLQIVKIARKLNKTIIYYLDDDLLNVPIGPWCPEEYYNQVVRKNLITVMSYCNILWGVNNLICEKYLKYTKDKIWISNRTPMSIEPSIEDNEQKLHILYAGSESHSKVLQENLSKVIEAVAIKYSETVDFTFIGANSGINNLNNVKNIPTIKNYDKYKEYVRNNNFSIGIAVIKDEPFFHCKYYNKFLEYTSINCVGIYTNCKPYTYVVKNNENGILCNNTYDEWYKSIEMLIINKKLRDKCLKNAKEYVNEYHNNISTEIHLEQQLKPYLKKSENKKTLKFLPSLKLIYIYSRIDMIYKEFGIFKGSIQIIKKILRKIKKIGEKYV